MTSTRRNSQQLELQTRLRHLQEPSVQERRHICKRKSLHHNAKRLVHSHRTASTAKMKAIVAKLADTYTRPAVEVPRLAVSDIQLFLAHIFIAENQPLKAVEHSLKYLESMGYIIEGVRVPQHSSGTGTPLMAKRWGLMMDSKLECWMALSKTYSFVASDLAVQDRKYAKVSYRICFCEDEAFQETCARCSL